ncbi:MAG: His/Gly/Thr/Pro-type tRNA ligase C-terminal domain-containing protein, partial [Flavobacteriales bacterium]
PIHRSDEELLAINAKFEELGKKLKALGISFKYDNDENKRPGWKFAEYESKGIPVRLAMGPRDLENGKVELARRDTKTKDVIDFEGIESFIQKLLSEIQMNLLDKAKKFRSENMQSVESYEDFKSQIDKGGFFLAHWDGTKETEAKIKEETQATIRCIILDQPEEEGKCMVTGNPSKQRVVFAKAY